RLEGEPSTEHPTGVETAPQDFPPESVATVDAQWLLNADGWGNLEKSEDRKLTWRWSQSPVVFLRPGNPLPPGEYVVKMYAFGFPGEKFVGTMKMDIYGLAGQQVFPAPQDNFFVKKPFRVVKPWERPLIRIYRPVFP